MASSETSLEFKWFTFNCIQILITMLLIQAVQIASNTDIEIRPGNSLRNTMNAEDLVIHELHGQGNKVGVMVKDIKESILKLILENRNNITKINDVINKIQEQIEAECLCNNGGMYHGKTSFGSLNNKKLVKNIQPEILKGIVKRSSNLSYSYEEENTTDLIALKTVHNLVNESITAFKNNNYDKAAEIFALIQDDTYINMIVSELYKNDAKNSFNSLLDFCKKITDVRKRFLLYQALRNEIEIHQENDGYKHLKLIENVNEQVVQAENLDEMTKKEVVEFLASLRTNFIYEGVNFLNSLFLYKNTTGVKFGNDLLNKTYYSDESLFEEIHQEFLSLIKLYGTYNETYNKVIKLTKSRYSPEQELLLHIISFSIIKDYDRKTLHKENMPFIKEMFENYRQIEKELEKVISKETLQRYSRKLKSLMPLSIYNLLFADKVCIKNVGLDQYLNTGGGRLHYYRLDKQIRNVYTSAKCSHDGFGVWQLQDSINDTYEIHNFEYGEAMYVSENKMISDRRYVFMWIMGVEPKHRTWKIEPSGDYVYIKNADYDEYLYGSNGMDAGISDWYNGHVYVHRNDDTDLPNNYSLWSIEDCTNIKWYF